MSSTASVGTAGTGYENDPGLAPSGPMTTATAPPTTSVAARVIGGTSALGMGVLIERGAGFIANILAARLGGASTFGAYSLAISTANQISTYAAGGIGATATRFSGKYPYGSAGYPRLARALTVVSLLSAGLAAAAMWAGAGSLAHLLGKQELAGLLRWTSLSAAGIIVLECARGFFVGQRRLSALLLMSLIVGVSMLSLLPVAARHHDPVRMIVVQGTVTSGAVLVCLLLARPLGLFHSGKETGSAISLGAMLREIWSFGLVQLAGLLGANLAGWWLTTLVARADTTLVQMSFFAIASQLRNMVGIAPGLLTEGSYAVMADPGGEASKTPHRVMVLCTFASVFVALALASAGIVFLPWALTALYGHIYAGAGLTVAVGLAIAVVHMGNAPAAARLTIVSIRATGIINSIWAVLVALGATSFLLSGHGSAAQAMLIYFLAHVISAAVVLVVLARKDGLPRGLRGLFGLTTGSALLMVALAWVRSRQVGSPAPLTGVLFLVAVASLAGLLWLGWSHGWLPSREALRSLRGRLLPRRSAHV